METALPSNRMDHEILYQIYLRTFSPEGTLAHAAQLLDHVASTGVTTVYLAALNEMDTDCDPAYWSDRQRHYGAGNPKNTYRMRDYFHVDPEFGTDADLKAFIDRAHALGLKVMMDLVYFHCGPTAPMLYEHPEFCEWGADGRPQNGEWHFPKLNFQSPALREYLWQNMEYYVRDYGVDGYRCDVGDYIPLDFWSEGVRRVRAINPNVMMLNEGAKPEYLSVFDLNYGWGWRNVAAELVAQQSGADALRGQIRKEAAGGQLNRFIRWTDNHDTASDDGAYRLERKSVSPAATDAMMMLNFLLPGTPFLYNGQEFADAHNCNMFTNRFVGPGNTVDWSMLATPRGQQRMRLMQALAQLRHDHPALCGGTFALAESDSDVVTFTRAAGADRVTVRVNLGTDPVSCPTSGLPLLQAECDGDAIRPFGWKITAE